MIEIRNPHSLLATFKTRPRAVKGIDLPNERELSLLGETWLENARLAKQHGVRAQKAPQDNRREAVVGRDRPKGPCAWVEPVAPLAIEELFSLGGEGHGLWIALDQVQDPQNLGAIYRTAAFFGARGLILTSDRSAGLTSVVYDIASGGVDAIPHAVVPNLKNALELAKERQIWVLGTSEHATESWSTVQSDRNWLVVFGNEEKGIRRLTQDTCDVVCKIDGSSDVVKSLNVATAAAILVSRLRT